ncbi:MAG: hypothetical protein IPK32_23330 [Verrucomicrobiaceae bacterium]|nr:hypothetical protein [Verrucomicrobiaceae bacterium]
MNNIYLQLGDEMMEKGIQGSAGRLPLVRRKSEISRIQKEQVRENLKLV